MRHAAWLVVLALAVTPACSSAINSADEAKGTEVDLDGLKATTPAEWVKEEPNNNLRWMQFRIPKNKDDKDDADLAISKGLGGGVEANIARWKASFKPPAGKTLDDVAKVEEIKIAGMKATYLDVSGTFTAPFSKAGPQPDYRMLAVYFDGKDNLYTFKLVGPAATVEAAKKGFDEWLKAFK
jgi:hypothetical protein